MDQQSSLAAFNHLIQQYPDLNMTLISDVLQACNQDVDRAYATLCEMVIPPDDVLPVTQQPAAPSHTLPAPHKVSPPRVHTPVRYAFPNEESGFTTRSTPRDQLNLPSSPASGTPPALRGAWASKNMGRRFRVDEMCNKYTWISRSVVEDLFKKNGECIELVESDILEMFPIDEPAAFAETEPQRRPRGVGQSRRQRIMAESLRAQAAEEIRRTASSGEKVSMASSEMKAMRLQLWKTREVRGQLQLLANQTRKQEHIEKAKQKDDELQRLSSIFLAKIRQSDEYRNGIVDLHGLTKDEAIRIVEWKLQDGGRKRFRLITGKGNHSHNYQAVLKPTLEKHFRSKRVSFTHIQDGVLSVNFP